MDLFFLGGWNEEEEEEDKEVLLFDVVPVHSAEEEVL